MPRLAAFLLAAASLASAAQTPAAPPAAAPPAADAPPPAASPAPRAFLSHEVHPDRTITFRFKDPTAKKVTLSIDAIPHQLPMTRQANGLWSVTTPPLPPEIYGYLFYADGVPLYDPRNPDTRPNLVSSLNVVEVPGPGPQPWDLAAVPHGTVSRHVYTTHTAQHIPAAQNAYVVYTPPNYDPGHPGGYPVLYLLHGWSDDETGWTAVGHANDILDALIAAGKAVPMIVVMPRGYGDETFVTDGFNVWHNDAKIANNTNLFEQTLESEIIPAVEREYDVARDRDHRAIAGLSMGGLETLTVGLRHPDQFGYIGAMSAAVFSAKFDGFLTPAQIAALHRTPPHVFSVACGTGDGLIRGNRTFVAWAKSNGLNPTPIETPGSHTWLVWRDNLINLAPTLFR